MPSTVFTKALAAAPFPDGSSADPAYDDPSVTFVIPGHFDRQKPFDIVVYFHGWETEIATQYPTGNYDQNQTIWYGLDDQVGGSQRNTILIAPQLPRKANSGRPGKLKLAGAAARFLAECRDKVVEKLGGDAAFADKFDAAPVIVASYSGGYQAAACFVAPTSGAPKRVKAVYMLDSLYGSKDTFVTWINGSSSKSIFVSLALDNGLPNNNTWLISRDLSEDVGGDVDAASNAPPASLAEGDTKVYRVTHANHFKIPIFGPPAGPLTWLLETLPPLAPVVPAADV